MNLDTMKTLRSLADECLKRDAEGKPSQATPQDVMNALLVLIHTMGSFVYLRDSGLVPLNLIETRHDAAGMALRQWCIEHVGIDPVKEVAAT